MGKMKMDSRLRGNDDVELAWPCLAHAVIPAHAGIRLEVPAGIIAP
jgi:hypothetical protein